MVIVVPVLLACWSLSAQQPLGTLTFGVYVVVAALLIASERWIAFDQTWGSAIHGSITDFTYVIVATSLDKATFVVCVTAVAAFGRHLSASLEIGLWPNGWGLGWQVLLALLIADAGAYFRHRLFHKSSMLWRFHRIHHSMTELYWIRSAYTHPLEQLCILLAIMLPISLLGAGDQVIAVVAFAFGLSGLLQHANIDSHSSILNLVFATPEVHRVHHRADEELSHSNFSAFFVFMDIVLGTYYRPERVETVAPVGLEGVTAFPGNFLTHLSMPFRRDSVGVEGDGG